MHQNRIVFDWHSSSGAKEIDRIFGVIPIDAAYFFL